MVDVRYDIAFKLYPYQKGADQDFALRRHPVVIVGGGPIGMALALDLGRKGTPVLVLDDHEGVGQGSRAICFAKRTLEICDRLGAGKAMIDKGVHGLGIAVATEIYKFNEEERDLILSTVVRVNNGRVKIVMNTGGEGTDVAVNLSKRAEVLGADALMILPPYFVQLTDDEIFAHYAAVSDAVGIPILLV